MRPANQRRFLAEFLSALLLLQLGRAELQAQSPHEESGRFVAAKRVSSGSGEGRTKAVPSRVPEEEAKNAGEQRVERRRRLRQSAPPLEPAHRELLRRRAGKQNAGQRLRGRRFRGGRKQGHQRHRAVSARARPHHRHQSKQHVAQAAAARSRRHHHRGQRRFRQPLGSNPVPSCSCSCCIAAHSQTDSAVSGENPLKCLPPPEATGQQCVETCALSSWGDSILGASVAENSVGQKVVDYNRFCYYECKPKEGADAGEMDRCDPLSPAEVGDAISADGNGQEVNASR